MRHGRGHGQGRGRHGGGRRALDHGHLRLLLLELIGEAPRHGYDLIREIETRTGGAYVPSPGVIYPALETLRDLGWIAEVADGARRSFRVTPEGEAELAREAETLAMIHERLGALQTGEAPQDPEDVRAAMHRLRHTVIAVMRREPGGETRRKVAAILAEAQEKISKLSED
ncbi:PadR family transcriptional regulator [Hyphomonas sp.]|uniref:PadR family transcriptional regulator n=1 Tax=Hyphomonas sp. TaxID=87 RepID=UPI00391AA25D